MNCNIYLLYYNFKSHENSNTGPAAEKNSELAALQQIESAVEMTAELNSGKQIETAAEMTADEQFAGKDAEQRIVTAVDLIAEQFAGKAE